LARHIVANRPAVPNPFGEALIAALRTGFRPTRRNMLHWASWAVTLAALLAMTVVLLNGQVYDWEIDFTRWAQGLGYPHWAFSLTADWLTNVDTPEGALIISSVALSLWLLRLRVEAALVLLTVPLHVLGNFPKALVARERPSEIIDGINGVGGLKSFPSGHAEFAITFYGFLLYLALIHVRNTAARVIMVAVWVLFALEVGFARIEDGRHWPLDIVAGYVVGIGLLSGLIWLHQSLRTASAASRRLP
jgi:membrane-associated phospholipid phosphatase